MDKELISFAAISLVSILNVVMLIYQTMQKVPREVEKMRAEKDAIYGDLAESNMEGAQISNTLLLERIRELKKINRDAWNHAAKLEKQLIEHDVKPVQFVALDSEPRIKVDK